ncbi:hypothetical protein N7532_006547 [Penicillium argentinense]|uniref:Enoyl reductase (ER) domain-containing protein n=1 Tax=Penicillium argentinense TaxID=1131581 RepID=A0A9W9FG58_9EURO|nr:uncharacterized protein N7532_006547 [Penicillium argentinense]KAJ5099546.1 hypothetical protein N7532_006547 [Penicillium argentinense]
MAPTMMKAAVCKEVGQPLVIEEVPVPKPEGRHLLVRVQVASLCHSDVSIVTGAVLGGPPVPLIIGHEAISVVEELGPDAAKYGIKVGDRVGTPLWQDWCFECYECKEIAPQFCPKITMKGVNAPGYFCEYTTVDAATAVVIPENTPASPVQLSPIFCAGVTVWDALSRACLKPGETLAVVGVGGLGEIATKYAQALGVKVVGIDVRDEQLIGVKEGGSADEILNSRDLKLTEVKERVRELNKGRGVDAAVVTSGSKPAYLTALNILRAEGRLMAVGIPGEYVPINMGLVATQAIKIIGAKVPGQIGTAACLDFCHRKGIYPKVHPRKFQLEDINEMMDLMKAGKVDDGRMAVQFF